MKSPLVPVRCLLLVLSLAISNELATADVPEPLQQRQQQLFSALKKVRGAIVGVSDGMGVAAGVVVSRDGIVLTASHVVDSGCGPRRDRRGPPERGVTITFPDGREYAASVLGKNRDADAAVLKIDDVSPTDAGFPYAEMGRITETKAGRCFAIGPSWRLSTRPWNPPFALDECSRLAIELWFQTPPFCWAIPDAYSIWTERSSAFTA